MSGKVYLVGIGPGSQEDMTYRAVDRIKRVGVVIGHKTCLKQVSQFITVQEIIAGVTPLERAEIAVNNALKGRDVAVVSSGDPGIYAIASTFFSYLKKKGVRLPVEVIPGVTAANTASALLGSPLGHDLALISLADLATPWSAIKRRLESAAEVDFVIVLYNPKGKTGDQRLQETIKILMTLRGKTTPVGIVTTAGENEKSQITILGDLSASNIDNEAILIIGNSETFIFNGRMITPRAYKEGVGY